MWNGLRRVSSKQKKKNTLWSKVKRERITYLREKFGYLPCEYCKANVTEPDAHHIDGNRNHNIDTNIYITDRLCHSFIEDNNLKVTQEDFQGYRGE
ncbi:hypothetical protein LCGC14_0527700 [marine sediment metagenome]|uniref:HNH nuclease domain-containing protein n=1 Tax=marine sediment metagenome TaxID=412755 RepID=A0A0F9S1E3_9ZZZZ